MQLTFADKGLWQRVGEIIDRAPSEHDLVAHRLEVLAAARRRASGSSVPAEFVAHERFAAIVAMAAPLLLDRIRRAYDGPAIIFKGPDAASYYPNAALRRYGDLDILVRDAAEAHRSLREAGFVEVGNPVIYKGIHHLRPLHAPGSPLIVEIHSQPKWLEGLPAPPVSELFESATTGGPEIGRLLRLPPEQHALLLAVHSWAHEPLRRLRDIIDVAAVAAAADRAEITRLAARWGIPRLWQTTTRVVDALLYDGPTPHVLHLWAQNIRVTRERTILEAHMQRWVSDFWAIPAGSAVRRLPAAFRHELRPEAGEGWGVKLERTVLAVRNGSRRRSQHRRQLDALRGGGGKTREP